MQKIWCNIYRRLQKFNHPTLKPCKLRSNVCRTFLTICGAKPYKLRFLCSEIWGFFPPRYRNLQGLSVLVKYYNNVRHTQSVLLMQLSDRWSQIHNLYEISKVFSRLSLASLLVSLGVIYWDRWPRRAALQTTKSPIIGVPSSMYLTHHIWHESRNLWSFFKDNF